MAPFHLARIRDITCELLSIRQGPVLLTKERENAVLVSFAKISNEIQTLHKNCSGNSNQASIEELDFTSKVYPDSEPHSEENYNCLSKILSVSVFFMTASNPYIRHASGKALISVFILLVESGSIWGSFIHLTFNALQSATSTVCSSPSLTGLLKMTSLVQVLHDTIKLVIQRCDRIGVDDISSVGISFSSIPWDMLDIVLGRENSELENCDGTKDFQEPKKHSLKKSLIHTTIKNLVPKIYYWCFMEHGDHAFHSISAYSKHKILVLMIKLSYFDHEHCCTLVLWLHLLHKYFEDVLEQPLSHCDAGISNSLSSSPFLGCMTNGEKMNGLCTRHLQRQAIFLLFKYCLSLMDLREETCRTCACKSEDPFGICEAPADSTNFNSIGLSVLFAWLQHCIPLARFEDFDSYLLECHKFAGDFVQLFLAEDDLLFELLLHMSSVTFLVIPMENIDNDAKSYMGKEDAFFHLQNIFNSKLLFHFFLAGIHYDHSVILDYLISGDTGIQCAQYLLRLLRLLCQLRGNHMEHLPNQLKVIQTAVGKREADNLSAQGACLSVQLPCSLIIPLNLGRDVFENEMKCLCCLKQSVEKLHEKNLFPYNPAALLKSLARFQDFFTKEMEVPFH